MTTTTFDPWLQELRAKQKYYPPDEVFLAVRGEAWIWPLAVEGNWSDGTLTAALRSAPDGGSVLATISVSAPSFNATDVVTTFWLSLASGAGSSPDSTGMLPADANGDGVEYFPMMIFLQGDGGTKELLFGTVFTLSGKV